MRLGSELMVPSRRGPGRGRGAAQAGDFSQSAQRTLAPTSLRLEAQQRIIETRYNYQLISRNCVNELLRAINGSFTGAAAAARELGAFIDPQADR